MDIQGRGIPVEHHRIGAHGLDLVGRQRDLSALGEGELLHRGEVGLDKVDGTGQYQVGRTVAGHAECIRRLPSGSVQREGQQPRPFVNDREGIYGLVERVEHTQRDVGRTGDGKVRRGAFVDQ